MLIMGEIYKKWGSIQIKDNKYNLELNYPSGSESDYSVHIQGKDLRMELSYSEFKDIYYGLISSYTLLKSYKKD